LDIYCTNQSNLLHFVALTTMHRLMLLAVTTLGIGIGVKRLTRLILSSSLFCVKRYPRDNMPSCQVEMKKEFSSLSVFGTELLDSVGVGGSGVLGQ